MKIGQYVVFTRSLKSSAIDDRVRIVNRVFQDLEVLEDGCEPVSVEKAELQWADGSFAGIQPVNDLMVVEPKEKFQMKTPVKQTSIGFHDAGMTGEPDISFERAEEIAGLVDRRGGRHRFSDAKRVNWIAEHDHFGRVVFRKA